MVRLPRDAKDFGFRQGDNAPRHLHNPPHYWVWRRWIVTAVAFSLVFVLSTLGIMAYVLSHNVKSESISQYYNSTPPVDINSGRALNILLIGTDDRSGKNAALGGAGEGIRSDTTILMHISADRKRIEMLSIPRDSLVRIPECTVKPGQTLPETELAMFNTAFAQVIDAGGSKAAAVGCVMNTVTADTGIKLDGFVMADFAGFARATTALGGVPVCLAQPFVPDQDYVNLKLPAGRSLLEGDDAITFVRARKGVGDGSDLERIVRQQYFLNNAFEKFMSEGVLNRPQQLFSLADAVTSALTVSENLSGVTDLVGLAYSLRHLTQDGISMMTVPNEPAPFDPNRLVWSERAKQVFANINADRPMNAAPPAATSSQKDDKDASAGAQKPQGSQGTTETAQTTPSLPNTGSAETAQQQQEPRSPSEEAQADPNKVPDLGVSKAAYDLGLRSCFPAKDKAK